MSALHHVRVRRVRGLPMPLPPTPKRPIAPPLPPAIFVFRDIPIRTRADAIEASGSWEEFLDHMVDLYVAAAVRLPIDLLDRIERLVPRDELEAHRVDITARIRARQDRNLAHLRGLMDEARRPGLSRSLISRFFGRSA